jgi:hypothetical protein
MTERLGGQNVVPVPSEVAVFDDPIPNDARRRSARLRWRAEIKEAVIVRLPKHTRTLSGKRFLETEDKRTAEAVGDALATKRTRRIERSRKIVKNQVVELKVNPVTLAGACLPSRTLLPQSWFRRDALEVAPALLGKILRKDGMELRITEVGDRRPKFQRFGEAHVLVRRILCVVKANCPLSSTQEKVQHLS